MQRQCNTIQWLRKHMEMDIDTYFKADAVEKEKAIYFSIVVFEKLNKFAGIEKINLKENKYLIENIYKEVFHQIQ